MTLKELKTVEYGKIKDLSCLILDKPIGKLSLKDSGRCIFLLIKRYLTIQRAYNQLVNNVVSHYTSNIIDKPTILSILNEKEENLEKLLDVVKKSQAKG